MHTLINHGVSEVMSMTTGTNMMYYGAAINSGAHSSGSSVLPPVDMTCQAINSTHYVCKVIENAQPVAYDIPFHIAVPLALVIGFMLACGMVIVYEVMFCEA